MPIALVTTLGNYVSRRSYVFSWSFTLVLFMTVVVCVFAGVYNDDKSIQCRVRVRVDVRGRGIVL